MRHGDEDEENCGRNQAEMHQAERAVQSACGKAELGSTAVFFALSIRCFQDTKRTRYGRTSGSTYLNVVSQCNHAPVFESK